VGQRFDRRVLALVEVRGGEGDWEAAQDLWRRQGWPVTEAGERGQGISAGVLAVDSAARMFQVEVRLHGAAYRAEKGATWRLQRLARDARLEMYVRRAEAFGRDRELLPEWRVHTTAHRPTPPAPRPVPRGALRAYRWSRARALLAERLGRHDTGAIVTGTPSEAWRLARLPLPEGEPRQTGLDVRPLDGRAHGGSVMRRDEDLSGQLARLVTAALITAFCVVVACDAPVAGRWLFGGLALVAFAATLRTGARLTLVGGRAANIVVAVMFAVLVATAEYGMSRSDALLMNLSALTVAGIWLLVRQWTWGEWAAWAVPLAFSAVVSFLATTGSVLHAIYADRLSLSTEDLNVPGAWQVISAARLLSYLSVGLLIPACWGFLKHFHLVRPVRVNGLVYVFVQLLVLISVAGLAIDSADRAAAATVDAAREGRQPPSYFGVQPEWTCVNPTVPLTELPGQGGRIAPEHPYLSFGVADSNAVLWDADLSHPLKVPADRVLLSPAANPDQQCEPQASERSTAD
jgi:hypothetical protein